MLELHCTGEPYEIGLHHGAGAAGKVKGSLDFYAGMFEQYAGKKWDQVLSIAETFKNEIETKWPRFFEEIRGVADGSGNDVLDIIALNVRSEIAFGLLGDDELRSDGCTSLAWKTNDRSYLCQNWDWMEEQKRNLVLMTIVAVNRPVIKMVTEAGIIGKIGLNSAGVGVCLNAIRSRGYDSGRLPIHLSLRLALESHSVKQAVEELERWGIAGSAHILVADNSGATGLEATSKTLKKLKKDEQGRILHTNHMIRRHLDIDESPERDSFSRLERLRNLVTRLPTPDLSSMRAVLDDHDNFPESICRFQQETSKDATLFSIVMELEARKAVLVIGKQCRPEEEVWLQFT